MYLVLLGLLFLGLKWAEVAPVAGWSWWIVLAPFAGAIAWWAWADATGYYRRVEMRKLDAKKDQRREKAMTALGTNPRSRRHGR